MLIKKSGFSLIELLIAVSAVSVVLVALSAAATRSVSTQVLARQEAQATQLAKEQLELIRAYRDRNGLTAVSSISCSPCALNSSLTPVPTIFNSPFKISLTISNPPVDTCPVDNKYIVSTVSWGSGANAHQVSSTTCLSDWK